VAVQVALSATGTLTVRNASGSTGVILDVSGYFTPDTTHAGYVPLAAPQRVLDQTIGQGGHADVTVTGLPGAPANPTAVVLNLTAAKPTNSTWLSVVPTPVAGVPAVSNLNLAAGAIRANLVTVPIGTNGQVSIYNRSGAVRTIADVAGYYTAGAGLAYYPLNPTRVLDTRVGTNTALGSTAPIPQATTYTLGLGLTTTTGNGIVTVPASAQAIVFNLTAIQPTASTYLTVYADPAHTSRPLASTLNAPAGAIVPNLVIASLAADRMTGLFNDAGATPVIADLAGYYAP
jgi:hypothetical protein